jgi:RNA polymerase sigma-70 factor (ECF subfamily)
VDPSDVIQEALVDANAQLPRYANERPLPFYPWLRQVTLSRLAQVHRFHLHAQRRAVDRETAQVQILDQSAGELARHFAAKIQSPSQIARAHEAHQRLEHAISQLPPSDHEVLVLRYVEQLSTTEAAAIIGVTANAFAQRHLRAVRRLRALVDSIGEDLR